MTATILTPSTTIKTRPIFYIWIATISALGAILALTIPVALRARHDAYSAQASLRNVARDAGVVTALRVGLPEVTSTDDQTRGGLTPRVTAALERAGLPPAALASLSPEAESQTTIQPGQHISRRRATLTLSGVTLPQVGKFLDAWRSAQPAWTPATIDLAPAPAGGKAPEAGGDLPLRVVVAIETVSVSHHGAPQ